MSAFEGLAGGNISTCVEQIRSRGNSPFLSQKHLHMRGADFMLRLGLSVSDGNISTCVEQITQLCCILMMTWKHLHMRGADLAQRERSSTSGETSPHAWSRSAAGVEMVVVLGNISTCVEQIVTSYG